MLYKILILVMSPLFLYAQYWGERSTEQSFERSALYFNSYYLSPFGMLNFKDAAVGLIDDPFLNLYLNPANLPDLIDTEMQIYLDFRGDRTSAQVVDQFVIPTHLAMDSYYYPRPDPRWFSTTRVEPEPIVSFGILTYPISEVTKKLFLAATYQLILKEERFYSMPYWIYNTNYYYDSFGVRNEGLNDMPIIDRYSAQDEMINQGHLYSAFIGYKLSDRLKLGFGFNGVIHSRDGDYLNSYQDEYGSIDNNDWRNKEYQSRLQDYDHQDFSLGMSYNIVPSFNVGLKAGTLTGEVQQKYDSEYGYNYVYNIPQESDEWSSSLSNSLTVQKWQHDGNTKYISFNFIRLINEDKQIRGYYRYTNSSVDLATFSTINDTSNYSSRWYYNYDQTWNNYYGNSSLIDLREGLGTRRRYIQEGLINIKWTLTDKSWLYAGIYFKHDENKINSNEPVLAIRESQHHFISNGNANEYHHYYKLYEDKWLEWRYKARMWSLQIPLLLDFTVSKHWGITLGVTRILNSWEIEDQTTAYFNKRERTENDEIKTETNFGERYTQPTQRITEDFTDVITSFNISVSPALKIRLLIDPEFKDTFRIAQWWLGFEARM